MMSVLRATLIQSHAVPNTNMIVISSPASVRHVIYSGGGRSTLQLSPSGNPPADEHAGWGRVKLEPNAVLELDDDTIRYRCKDSCDLGKPMPESCPALQQHSALR